VVVKQRLCRFFTRQRKRGSLSNKIGHFRHSYVQDQGPFEWIQEMKSPHDAPLSPITVVGDSFFDGMMRSGLEIYFKKIYKSNWSKLKLEEFASTLPSDSKYLLLEFIEVNDGAYTQLMRGLPSK